MKKEQEYTADAINRTRDFIGVHADAVAGLADSENRTVSSRCGSRNPVLSGKQSPI